MGNIVRSQSSNAPADLLAHVGANVRQLRAERGLNQQQLAEASGVSRRMIVAIEGGEANVSLSVLDRLAAALGVRFTRVVRDPMASDSHRIAAFAWRGATPVSRADLLGAAPSTREAELWLWSLGVGERYPSEDNSGDWHEMLFVLEGTLKVEFADGEQSVGANDFFIFSSAERYAFINAGDATLRFIRNVVL